MTDVPPLTRIHMVTSLVLIRTTISNTQATHCHLHAIFMSAWHYPPSGLPISCHHAFPTISWLILLSNSESPGLFSLWSRACDPRRRHTLRTGKSLNLWNLVVHIHQKNGLCLLGFRLEQVGIYDLLPSMLPSQATQHHLTDKYSNEVNPNQTTISSGNGIEFTRMGRQLNFHLL